MRAAEGVPLAAAAKPGPIEAPRTWLLSNGEYSVFLTDSGTGSSWHDGLALTRWRGDRLENGDGQFLYLRDPESGAFWSLGHQPVRHPADRYEAAWEPGVCAITREDHGLECRLEVCVAPDAAMEIRWLTLRNRSRRRRTIEVTSYAEVVLDEPAAAAAHPAFSKLFVQTEWEGPSGALLARRRPRSPGQRCPWMVHALHGEGDPEHETDRARFLGRGGSHARPRALRAQAPLSGTTGDVLDPAFCIRRVMGLDSGANVRLVCLLGVAPDREEALDGARRWSAPDRVGETFARARSRARRELKRLGVGNAEAERFQTLAASLLYGQLRPRRGGEMPAFGVEPRILLPRYGLSEHRPLVLAELRGSSSVRCLAEVLKIHRFWRAMGLASELLVLHEEGGQICAAAAREETESVHVRRASEIPAEDLRALAALARLVLTEERPAPSAVPALEVRSGESGEDAERVAGACPGTDGRPGTERRARPKPDAADGEGGLFVEPLRHFNGHGGFTTDGREYVIRLAHKAEEGLALPPRPWINVVANECFGFLISETGAGYTWSQNSREHRLTPWANDPVLDPHGEALYVRDEESGAFWSPLPGPAPAAAAYEMRHGFGYSRCRHVSGGLGQEVWAFVPCHDPVKITRVRLTNRSGRARRLSLYAYQRLVLGALPEESARSLVTGREGNLALLARNPLSGEFAHRVAFAAAVAPDSVGPVHFTADREAFVGHDSDLGSPAALRGSVLDGKTGPGLDPCFAVQVVLDLGPGQSLECAFLFGEGSSLDQARELLRRYREPGAIERAWEETREFWIETLTRVQVETPAPAIDLMVNGWLLYQALSCRIWGRSALYQSGGACGFRDQLQDAAAFVHVRPDLTRNQILLHAAHQFVEGDVLHWWHPPLGWGLRTRFADDLLWLAYVTSYYVRATGDRAILGAEVPFVAARPLGEGEDEAFVLPSVSEQSADLYEHCCRAIDRSLMRGRNGLPLFGTGDWNDGMNRVGREGRGESVWVGFFLYGILEEFIPVCERRGDGARTQRYRAHRDELYAALDEAGWDGEWYRRGYYDDGAPLGSSSSDECRIDALAQAWAVLSGAAPSERMDRALDSVERQLISEPDGLIRLLRPPFDRTPHDPGYIKGYVPGVRENGGQYTHAALWVVSAMAARGRKQRAARLLEMLSPVSHALTPERVAVYQVEPYVIAADVYGETPHVGRGGWTWYTGSAGWMFRIALESVLGFRIEGGNTLVLRPCVPAGWPDFAVTYRPPDETTLYRVEMRNSGAGGSDVVTAAVDGAPAPIAEGAARIALARDGRSHRIEVTLG